MASSSRSRDIPQEEWEQYRAEVTSLFQSKTYQEIIDHLDHKFDFRPSLSQFALQVRARWKLKKNFKRKAQKDTFNTLPIDGERPAEVMVENRLISYKRLRKAAVATSAAERKLPVVNEPMARPETGHDGTRCSSPITKAFCILPKVHKSDLEDQNDGPVARFGACLDAVVQCLQSVQFITSDSSDASELSTTLSRRAHFQLVACGSLLIAPPAERTLSGFTLPIPDVTNRAVLRLRDFSDELAQRGVLGHIRTQSGRMEYLTATNLLRSKIYEASNNLLDTAAMAKLLAWILKEKVLWIVEILIDNQLPTMAIFANLLFRTAVAAGDTVTVAALLARDIHPDDGENNDARPLRIAIENSDAAMVRLLLEAGARMDSAQKDLVAASKGPKLCPIIIKLLLRKCGNTHIRIDQAVATTLLNTALELNAIEIVKDLPIHQILANELQHKHNITALQIATKHCNSDIVQMLITAGSDVNTPNGPKYATAREVAIDMGNADYFITPLQYAAKRNDHTMAKILLDNGACVDGFDFYNFFPCGYHINEYGKARTVFFPCSSPRRTYHSGCEESDYLRQQEEFHSPLQAAASNKSINMVQLLLKHMPIINRIGSIGTALQVACMQSNNIEIIHMLINEGADINSPPHKWHGQTALQAAILSRDTFAVNYLMAKRAKVSARSGIMIGLTALQAAAKIRDIHLAKDLIALGANVNEETSRFGCERSLNLVTRSGNLEFFDLLVKNGADVGTIPLRAASPQMHTILLDAISSGSTAMIDRLLAVKAELRNVLRQELDLGCVALAIIHGRERSYKTVKLLLSLGASSNVRDRHNKTPLQLAIQHGATQYDATLSLIGLLVDNGADVNATLDGSSSALLEAIRKQDEKVVELLIRVGSNVDLPVADHAQAPLVVAVSTGNFGIMRLVLDAIKTINCDSVFTALVEAISSNQPEVVELLLSSSGVEAKHMNIDEHLFKERPLRKAIEMKNHNLINMLLEHDVCYYSRDRRALAQAAYNGDIQLLRRLLALKTECDTNGNDGSLSIYDEALKEAVSQRHIQIALTLIAVGADVNACWRNATDSIHIYFTCMLTEAIVSESLGMVKLLIDKGAYVNGPSLLTEGHSSTPFQSAAKQGNSIFIQLLLDSGADVNKDALDVAAECGRLDTVHKLLSLDKEPETLRGRTKEAARFATLGNHPMVAQYLMDWQVN